MERRIMLFAVAVNGVCQRFHEVSKRTVKVVMLLFASCSARSRRPLCERGSRCVVFIVLYGY
jgi:hypothetical protein